MRKEALPQFGFANHLVLTSSHVSGPGRSRLVGKSNKTHLPYLEVFLCGVTLNHLQIKQ